MNIAGPHLINISCTLTKHLLTIKWKRDLTYHGSDQSIIQPACELSSMPFFEVSLSSKKSSACYKEHS